MSVGALVCAVGVAGLGCGMVIALVGRRWRAALAVQAAGIGAPSIGAPFRSDYAPALGIDRLSGFFLLVLALIAVPAALYARDALRDARRPAVTAVLSAAFCLALVGLVAARDVTTFLAFWELMTLLPAITARWAAVRCTPMASVRSLRWRRFWVSAPKRGRCRCIRGCRVRTRWPRPMSRR